MANMDLLNIYSSCWLDFGCLGRTVLLVGAATPVTVV